MEVSRLAATPRCQENTNDGVAGRVGERQTSRVQDSRGKAIVHVPRASQTMHVQQMKETV